MKKMKALQIIAAAMAVTVAATSTQAAHYFQIHRIFQIILPGKIPFGIKKTIREILPEKVNPMIHQELS